MKVGSPEHREHLFYKTLEWVCNSDQWEQGTIVHAKGYGQAEGIVIDVMTDEKDCEWLGLKCKLVAVYMSGNEEAKLFHPTDLTVITKVEHKRRIQ